MVIPVFSRLLPDKGTRKLSFRNYTPGRMKKVISKPVSKHILLQVSKIAKSKSGLSRIYLLIHTLLLLRGVE